METRSFKINGTLGRIALAGGAAALIAVFLVCAKWSFANMAAQRAETAEIAALTARLAPEDPQTHYASGVLLEKTFDPGDLEQAIIEYETAAALSPNNYLLWLALGRARERVGDSDGGEKAVRKALELAPNYAAVHWTLGNILLRKGLLEEAFSEVRAAVAGEPLYADAAVAITWQILEGNTDEVRRAIGDSQSINTAFVKLLAREKRFDEAFDVWSRLLKNESSEALQRAGDELLRALIEAKKYHLAVRLKNSLNASGVKTGGIGHISNPGFESEIRVENSGPFEWQIAPGAHPQIVLSDGQKRTGDYSLWLIFNSADGKEFRTVSQTVAVEAGRTYELEVFYKAELKTAATNKWEVVDASTGNLLGATNILEAEADWSPAKVKFSVPPGSEAVTIRLVRDACISAICPIAGRVWFDDFSLRGL